MPGQSNTSQIYDKNFEQWMNQNNMRSLQFPPHDLPSNFDDLKSRIQELEAIDPSQPTDYEKFLGSHQIFQNFNTVISVVWPLFHSDAPTDETMVIAGLCSNWEPVLPSYALKQPPTPSLFKSDSCKVPEEDSQIMHRLDQDSTKLLPATSGNKGCCPNFSVQMGSSTKTRNEMLIKDLYAGVFEARGIHKAREAAGVTGDELFNGKAYRLGFLYCKKEHLIEITATWPIRDESGIGFRSCRIMKYDLTEGEQTFKVAARGLRNARKVAAEFREEAVAALGS